VSRLKVATEIRARPDATSAVVRVAAAREQFYELSRTGDWVEVYFKNQNTVGYVGADALQSRK
jgi:hypothetical protein